SSRRRHTRCLSDWSSTCALPIYLKNGGVLSIASLYEESSKLSSIHHAAVVICTIPGDPPLLKYRWFPNNNYLLDADAVISRCSRSEERRVGKECGSGSEECRVRK